MSYDLYFWKPQRDLGESPRSVWDRLCDEEEIDIEGLTWLSVSELKAHFAKAFPKIEDYGTQLNWEDEKGSFQVDWIVGSKPQHTLGFFINCSWALLKHPDILDCIIQVAIEMECGMYDPQEDKWREPVT